MQFYREQYAGRLNGACDILADMLAWDILSRTEFVWIVVIAVLNNVLL